jgi:hypothetical protein
MEFCLITGRTQQDLNRQDQKTKLAHFARPRNSDIEVHMIAHLDHHLPFTEVLNQAITVTS